MFPCVQPLWKAYEKIVNNPCGRIVNFGPTFGARSGRIYCTIYFNAAFVPLMVLLVVAMGFGLGSKWKRINPTELLRLLRSPALIAVVLGLAFPFTYAGEFNASTALAAALLVWLLAASWVDLSRRLRHQNWWRGLRQLNPGYYGMLMAHLGVGVMALGIAVVSHYSVQKDLRMGVGDQATLGQYEFTFMGVKNVVTLECIFESLVSQMVFVFANLTRNLRLRLSNSTGCVFGRYSSF